MNSYQYLAKGLPSRYLTQAGNLDRRHTDIVLFRGEYTADDLHRHVAYFNALAAPLPVDWNICVNWLTLYKRGRGARAHSRLSIEFETMQAGNDFVDSHAAWVRNTKIAKALTS